MLDVIHRAWLCGFDAGYAAGQMLVSIDAARSWLLARAQTDTQKAVDQAHQRHGPQWAEAIRQQAENDNDRRDGS